MSTKTTVIVGAGLAGWRAAESLRRLGYDGRILLVGREAHPPYDRPPLSKHVLAGARSLDDLDLATAEERAGLDVELLTGRRVNRICDGVVVLDGAEVVVAHRILVATGVEARLPDGYELGPRVHVLRTKDDAARLAAALGKARSLLVLGGGFVGAEVASTARAAGLDVVIVEARPVLLGGALPEPVGEVVAGWHRDAGVQIVTGSAVADLQARPRSVEISLADGSTYSADQALIGFGTQLDTRPFEDLPCGPEGLRCDAEGRVEGTASVFAAGDVAAWADPVTGERRRRDHWSSAADQGTRVAHTMLGVDVPEHLVHGLPYFWSDQQGRKIQVLGHPERAKRSGWIDHEEGDRLVYGHWDDDHLVGVVTLGSPRLLVPYRKQLAARTAVG